MAATVASQAQGIESKIRTLAQTKRIRIKDYFQDFDKLKGGAVTGKVIYSRKFLNDKWNFHI